MGHIFVPLRRLGPDRSDIVAPKQQQLIDAAASAAARADVEKEKERILKETAIQRAEKAEKERDDIIDGFICTRVQHLASHRQATGSPLASHLCTTNIDLRKKNLQSWLSSLQGMNGSEYPSIAAVLPPIHLGASSSNKNRVAAF